MLTGSLFFFSRHRPFPSLRASYFRLACHYLRAWHQLFGCQMTFFKTCVKLASSLSPYRGCVTAILFIGLLILSIARLNWWRNLMSAGIYYWITKSQLPLCSDDSIQILLKLAWIETLTIQAYFRTIHMESSEYNNAVSPRQFAPTGWSLKS